MLFLRVLGALILAAFIGFVIGMLKDYFKLFPEQDFSYVWPIACAASAFVGALLMACMKPSRVVQGGAPPRAVQGKGSAAASMGSRPGATQVTSPLAAKPLPPGMDSSAEVPGMPTFDFDKAKATGAAVDKAQAGQSGKGTS